MPCVVLSTLVMVELFCQVAKKEKAVAPLLGPVDVLVNVVCHSQLNCCLSSFKQLIETVAVLLVLHVQLMLTVRGNIHLQFSMDLIGMLHLLIATKPIFESIYILVDETNRPLRLLERGLSVELENFFWKSNGVNFTNFLLFYFIFIHKDPQGLDRACFVNCPGKMRGLRTCHI